MNKKAILFDFDGVFSCTFAFHRAHLEQFTQRKVSAEDLYNVHKGNVYANDGKGLELHNFDVPGYYEFIEKDFQKIAIVPGMDAVVAHARAIGDLYIVSSGSEENITQFLIQNGVNPQQFTIYGVETHPSKTVKCEKIITETGVHPDNMIFITDTLGDITEAAEVGVASIAVLWGFHNSDTLEQGAPFGFAQQPRDLITLIDTFFGL